MIKTGKSRKKNLKIAAATGMTLFSLVAVFTATIAWFVQNHSISGTGMTIRATEETGRLNKIEIFEYIETVQKPVYDENGRIVYVDGVMVTEPCYSFSDQPSGTIYGGSGTFDDYFLMGDYNPLATEHPLLILFTLESGFSSIAEGDMYIKGETNASGFLGSLTNGNPTYKLGDVTSSDPAGTKTLKRGTKTVTVDGASKTVDCYPLSSAVNFRCTHYSDDDYDDLIGYSLANRIDIPTASITLRESFVNFATSGEGITFTDNPTIFLSPGLDENNEPTPIQYVAMVVDYDPNAISAIYSTYLGNSTLEGTYGGELYFTCDWIVEVF